GCSSTPKPEPIVRDLPLDSELQVFGQTPEPLLNVSITVFDVAAFDRGSLHDSASQVRSLEARFVPFILKRTLDRTAAWGAVRVLPRSDASAELSVTGKVLHSDGIELKVWITAVDATGRVWIDQLYQDVANDTDYAQDPVYTQDPFQDLYNRIANDLSRSQFNLPQDARRVILDTAFVQYANLLSPESFGSMLQEQEGRIVLVGLPAEADPLFQRVQRIRDSEYLFADGVDAHYESLFAQLGQTYAWWRYYSYELIVGNERLSEKDAKRGATEGSWYAMERIYKTYKESKMNEDALRELTDSFDRETAPTVGEISGRLYELTGTLDYQYGEWRRILREVYRTETGT
ncbi:MAG: hypothetical protein AAF525_22500, partial [Pseudomonadota bacterium]